MSLDTLHPTLIIIFIHKLIISYKVGEKNIGSQKRMFAYTCQKTDSYRTIDGLH